MSSSSKAGSVILSDSLKVQDKKKKPKDWDPGSLAGQRRFQIGLCGPGRPGLAGSAH